MDTSTSRNGLAHSATGASSVNPITAVLVARSNSTLSRKEWSPADSSSFEVHGDDFDFASVLTDSRQTTRVALRRKPKSTTISVGPPTHTSSVHMRRPSGILKTLSYPTFHPHTEPDETRPVSAHSAIAPSGPQLQSTSIPPNRSPPQKRRPPASHSSYGVGTTLGPPPSYTTQQRTLSQDRLRVEQPRQAAGAVAERVIPQPNEVATTAKQQPCDEPTSNHLSALPIPGTSNPDISSPETIDSQSLDTPRSVSDTTTSSSAGGTNMTESTKAVPTGLGLDGAHDDAKASSSDETQKSEDLFLHIARTDALRISAPRTEKRRSRISLPFLSGARPQTAAARSSPMSAQFDSDRIPSSERLSGKRSSPGQHITGALASSYPNDTRSHVGRPSAQQSTVGSIGGSSQLRSRRHSTANGDPLRPSTRSGRSRMVSEILYADKFREADQVATESTVSTAAPSTVWSELDDLKSRIKRLELTGKLPSSSAAAMATGERPRTATTLATALSNSPKHSKGPVAALPSRIEGVPSSTHPLLHEALSSAKSGISQDVYQKLHTTAQDALHISSMLSQEGYGSNGAALSAQTERQIRRRTESICRSLTELAIVMLSDTRNLSSPTIRPASRDQYIGSIGASDRPPVMARVQSRLESRLDNRRTSLLGGQTYPANPPEADVPTSSLSSPFTRIDSESISAVRASRPVIFARNRRTQNQPIVDGATDNEEEASLLVATRPVSRATTEVGSTYRSMARDRANFSREYTQQHPLPTQTTSTNTASAPVRAALPSHISIKPRVTSRLTHMSPASDVGSPSHLDTSSPITTPSHTAHQKHSPAHTARPPFTISIERRNPHLAESNSNIPNATTPESTPGGSSDRRTSSTRRSIGLVSRISNVSNRLRAARAERQASSSNASPNMGAVRSPLSRKASDQRDGQDVEDVMQNEELPESVTVQRGS